MQSNRSASASVDAAGRSRPLTEAAKHMVQQSLAVRSVAATVALLNLGASGPVVSQFQVDSIRRSMAKKGKPLWRQHLKAAAAPSAATDKLVDQREERVRYSQAEDGCHRLLSAQLLTGQHYHTFDNAQRIADAIGAPSALVRPGIGDTAVRA